MPPAPAGQLYVTRRTSRPNRRILAGPSQAAALVKIIDDFSSPEEPVVLAGDLNAHHEPLWLQPVATNPGASSPGPPVAPQAPATLESITPLALPVLREAGFDCGYTVATGAPPSFTHWAGRFDLDMKNVFDYVLLRGGSCCTLEATAALLPPDEHALAAASECRLPSAAAPSDHIPLAVDLVLIPVLPRGPGADTDPV